MRVWNLVHAARWKCRTQNIAKSCHLRTIVQLCRAISSQLSHVSKIGKKLLSSNISSTCPHNMVNFGPLAAEISPVLWGSPANFIGFRVLAALQHGTLVVGVIQTLRRWTEGATYIRRGGHHAGHWPIFVVHFWIGVLWTTESRFWLCSHWSNSAHCRLCCIFSFLNRHGIVCRIINSAVKTAH